MTDEKNTLNNRSGLAQGKHLLQSIVGVCVDRCRWDIVPVHTRRSGHILPVLIAWPVILYVGYSTWEGVSKTVLIGRKWPSIVLWANITFAILPITFFVPFLENYLRMTKVAGALDQVLIPFGVWPLCLFIGLYTYKQARREALLLEPTSVQRKLVLSAGLTILTITTYLLLEGWVKSIFESALFQCG